MKELGNKHTQVEGTGSLWKRSVLKHFNSLNGTKVSTCTLDKCGCSFLSLIKTNDDTFLLSCDFIVGLTIYIESIKILQSKISPPGGFIRVE